MIIIISVQFLSSAEILVYEFTVAALWPFCLQLHTFSSINSLPGGMPAIRLSYV